MAVPGLERLVAADKAGEIDGQFDLIELGPEDSPEADIFCPQCGSARTVGGYLGDPGFRWCQLCGARWRLPGDSSAESGKST